MTEAKPLSLWRVATIALVFGFYAALTYPFGEYLGRNLLDTIVGVTSTK